MERLLDEGHARLVSGIVTLLKRRRWEVGVEVSFSEYGERGSIDVLAWHPVASALLVVEVKSELGGVEGTLRPLDAKQRLAPAIAAKQFGWRPRTVSRILVLPEERSARRAVQRHEAVLRAALPAAPAHRPAVARRRCGRALGRVMFRQLCCQADTTPGSPGCRAVA